MISRGVVSQRVVEKDNKFNSYIGNKAIKAILLIFISSARLGLYQRWVNNDITIFARMECTFDCYHLSFEWSRINR